MVAGTSDLRADSANSQAIRITNAGLRNSDGWMLTPSEHDPAPRALDLGAEEQRRDHEGKADDEDDEGDAADLARRQKRGRDQHRERRNEIDHLPVDEIERIEPEPRRHRRACGQATG